MDTKMVCFMEPEAGHAATKIQPGFKVEAVKLVRECGGVCGAGRP